MGKGSWRHKVIWYAYADSSLLRETTDQRMGQSPMSASNEPLLFLWLILRCGESNSANAEKLFSVYVLSITREDPPSTSTTQTTVSTVSGARKGAMSSPLCGSWRDFRFGRQLNI